MRELREIIVHCSATPEGRHFTVSDIDKWHKARGWSGIGYHYVVCLDGTVHEGRPISKIGAHVAGRNKGTIGVCYIGGVAKDGKTPKDTRTPAQKDALVGLLKRLLSEHPSVNLISGHHDYAAKACPSFPARKEYASLTKGKTPASTAPKSNSRYRWLQRLLLDLDYDAGLADGIEGPRTRKAIRAFQKDNGLKQTGKFDPDTVNELRFITEGPAQKSLSKAIADDIASQEPADAPQPVPAPKQPASAPPSASRKSSGRNVAIGGVIAVALAAVAGWLGLG